MFDVSLVELAVIALVALLVLGPERLPKAARMLGFYVRRARQSWHSVRAEFEREIATEELKRQLKITVPITATHELKQTAQPLATVCATQEPINNALPMHQPVPLPTVQANASVENAENIAVSDATDTEAYRSRQ